MSDVPEPVRATVENAVWLARHLGGRRGQVVDRILTLAHAELAATVGRDAAADVMRQLTRKIVAGG